MAKKTKGQELAEKLTWSTPNIGKKAPKQMNKAQKFCEGYKKFLDEGKTERECVRYGVEKRIPAFRRRGEVSARGQGLFR